MRMTFDEFCNTFSNIKYLGCNSYSDENIYYFQVDDPRNSCRKLVYYFGYEEAKQYNPLYNDYELCNSDEGEVERIRLKDYSANNSGFDYQEFKKNLAKNYRFIVCDDKGNKLQVENLQDNEIFYVNGDQFILTNGRVKCMIGSYPKPKTIPDSILNNLK